MGCGSSKEGTQDAKTIQVRYQEAGLTQPFSDDYENNFEKEVFMAINLLRHSPRSFIPHVQRVHQKGLVKGSKSMSVIIEKLKSMTGLSTVKIDDGAKQAVRQHNEEIVAKAEDMPTDTGNGNLAKLEAITGREARGAEA